MHAEVTELTAENALLREEHQRLMTLANAALAKEAEMREQHEGIIASRNNCLAALEVSEKKGRDAEEEREQARDDKVELTGYVRRLRDMLGNTIANGLTLGERSEAEVLLHEVRDV